MRMSFFIVLLLGFSFTARADHITGGEMYYTYIGLVNGQNQYEVILKLFMRCNSGRQFPDPAIISVFSKDNMARLVDISVELLNQRTIQITNPDPCITNPPRVCYEVALYNFTVSLPYSQKGFILASQVNYRINGISNLDGSSQVGATYTCEIPGTFPQATGFINNSAVFTGSDLVMVCAGNFFSYSFAARDPDRDELRYTFCTAYRSSNLGVNGVPAGDPPYNSVPYDAPDFMESFPLGNKVTVDPATGLISGVAPPAGVYVVTVCVDEIRNGKLIATQRKDVQINVADCSIAGALLDGEYMVCGDTRTATITNLSNSPLIQSYEWTISNPTGAAIFSSQSSFLNYTFTENGTYNVRLIINKGQACSDTTLTKVLVYPGLKPDFTATGICFTKPTIFSDRSTTLSGTINSWKWDFDEPSVTSDFSTSRNPVYTYPSEGVKTPGLIVTTTDGCRDTVFKSFEIIDKPPLALAFRDTLICVNDRVQLQANGIGSFSWSPPVNMMNANTASPFVSPAVTTMYYVNVQADGCINQDSVQVRVTDHVTLQAMQDTVICSGDTIQLRINSDGLRYEWSPASQLNDASVQNPQAVTASTSSYQVTAFIGGCSAVDNIIVTTVPYPLANAGKDTVICYNTSVQLQAFTDGNSWSWMPAPSLSNTTLLNPIAAPEGTFSYIFTAKDTRGCPKPGIDTVIVTVLPKIIPSAGSDTSIIVGQPLQFNASGGDAYLWSPAFYLSAVNIANPVAVFNEPSAGLRYKVQVYNSVGCYDSAFVLVKIFATPPTVFVPTAFTPNNDGNNDVLRPVVAGMKRFDYFQVYNRWGQLVFSTSVDGKGWDGKINGEFQSNNVYVWVVKAVDFNGAPYFKKGTVTLIR